MTLDTSHLVKDGGDDDDLIVSLYSPVSLKSSACPCLPSARIKGVRHQHNQQDEDFRAGDDR